MSPGNGITTNTQVKMFDGMQLHAGRLDAVLRYYFLTKGLLDLLLLDSKNERTAGI